MHGNKDIDKIAVHGCGPHHPWTASPMDLGPYNAWVSRPLSRVKLGAIRAPSLTTTSLLANLNAWTA